MLGSKRIPALILTLAALSAQVGCVALNIPSQRLHDPDDKGGVFGPWKRHHGATGCQTAAGCQSAAGQACAGDGSMPCLDGGPLVDEDPHNQMGQQPGEPEVPWPRFHPLPTRPLLSGSVGS